MKHASRWLLVGALFVFGVAAFFGVRAILSDGNLERSASAGAVPSTIEYRLKWLINAGFIGDVYADTFGLYRNEGLEVQVAAGGPDRDALTALSRPGSDTWFAVASADQVVKAVYGGSSDLRVIAQIYSGNPVQWIYRTSLGEISEAADLRGRRIGVTTGDNDAAIMNAYLSRNNIPLASVSLIGVQFDYAPFLTGAVDLFPVYSNTQGIELQRQMQQEGVAVAFFDPSKGRMPVKFAANAIVTTSRVITDHPDVVERFLNATLRGWHEALQPQNLDDAVRALQASIRPAPTDPESLRAQIIATRPLVIRDDSQSIGTIDVAAWQETERLMYDSGILDRSHGVRPPWIGIETYIEDRFVAQGRRLN